ncbi:MAG: 6-pyruvoyl tetrahydropterin synthase family protein [Phycisphaerales bacterium]|nr:6-pyruvoyl tetrahydropterin synthase family protein [Phycisphaerales bacterium]
MYSIRVERVFSAAHALVINGVTETLHGHDWRVRVTVEAPSLDADGLLCDFHDLERHLDEILRPFRDANLNDTPPFDRQNPSAEHVALHIARSLDPVLPKSVTAVTAAVTEAPGCEARYRLDRS